LQLELHLEKQEVLLEKLIQRGVGNRIEEVKQDMRIEKQVIKWLKS
jgi:hypothetical protein